MKLADQIVAWILTLFPLLHIAFTPRKFTIDALWFLAGGMLMVLGGIVNLLRIRYAPVAPGVRRVSMVTNVVLAFFVLACGIAADALLGPPGIFLLLYCAATVFSFRCPPSDVAMHPAGSSA